jgi:Na+-translocating ferredoxin:NAD+ oxidoreductase RnfD subunit
MTTSALTLGRGTYPLILPNVRDPRLHVAAVIITVHVLGQAGLHFTVSVWQILAAILTCAVLEVAITFHQKRVIVWPASAMLTGSGVGLILRVVGTPPDDHWSTFAVGIFAVVAGLALLSKYVVRYRGTPLFNPSNVALVAVFVALGSTRVEPLDFWWAPPNAWIVAAYTVILTGGVLITWRLRLMSLAVSFWVTLAVGLGILAVSGHCMTANWAFAPVCGVDFWRVIVTSPEVFIFVFFMITDPRTVPAGRVGRIVFGALVAVIGLLLLAPQTTEFWAKVGLLSGLTLVCAARPLLERILPRPNSAEDDPRHFLNGAARYGVLTIGVLAVAAGILLAGAPARGVLTAPQEEALDSSRMDPATFPAISIDTAVTDWDPTLTGSTMQAIVLTAAQNLEIEDQALLQADPDLLTQVDHGDRLAEMQDRIHDAVVSGTTRIDHFQADSVEVSLLRPFGKQDGLSLGLTSRGTLTSETYDTSGSLLARTTSPFSATFVVRRATGARWLNVAVLPAESDATDRN